MKIVLMMALAAQASANTGYRQHVLQAHIVGPAQPVPHPQVPHAFCLVLLPAIRVRFVRCSGRDVRLVQGCILSLTRETVPKPL